MDVSTPVENKDVLVFSILQLLFMKEIGKKRKKLTQQQKLLLPPLLQLPKPPPLQVLQKSDATVLQLFKRLKFHLKCMYTYLKKK